MGQSFTINKRAMRRTPFTWGVEGGLNPTKELIASCAGPVTSVSDGMVADVSNWLSHCYGAEVIDRLATSDRDFALEGDAGSGFTSSQMSLVAFRRSTGALLSSAVNLSGDAWLIKFLGD